MELKIKETQFPQIIEFNYEELKKEITDTSAKYLNMVYTDDSIKLAKSDRSKLNKFVKALSDERIKVKKECLKPYEDFETKIKELSAIVNEPITLIEEQVKTYEHKQKEDKLIEIKAIFERFIGSTEGLTFEKLFDEKWLNASTSLKKIEDEMSTAIGKFETDLKSLEMLPDFSFEAKEYYIRTMDINGAIAEGKRLSELQKKKIEYQEEQKKRAAEREAQAAQTKVEPIAEQVVESTEDVAISKMESITEAPEKQWINFKAFISIEEAKALGKFCKDNGIVIEKA